jgi:hypothetical protein
MVSDGQRLVRPRTALSMCCPSLYWAVNGVCWPWPELPIDFVRNGLVLQWSGPAVVWAGPVSVWANHGLDWS